MLGGAVADIIDSFQIFFENGDSHLFCDAVVEFVPDKSVAFSCVTHDRGGENGEFVRERARKTKQQIDFLFSLGLSLTFEWNGRTWIVWIRIVGMIEHWL